MPTYAELAAEPWWIAEFEAPALAAFNERLRAYYGHTNAETGSKGDNSHLKGRHRSRDWDLHSRYCTNRVYATTDLRDKAGDADWLRATDIGITGAELRAASARLNMAVRAGRLPALAEWFGTLDGVNVTGWYEGHQSSSDSSHLYHLHVGLWTGRCDDSAQLALLGDVVTGITGTEGDSFMALTEADQQALIWRIEALLSNRATVAGGPTKGEANELANELARIRALAESGQAPADVAAVLAGVRDAVADGLEGGAAAVRADRQT